MMLAGGAFAAGQAISFDLMSQMKTRKLISVKVVTGMLGIASNFAGAYWYGVAGVVGAAIVFSISYLVWMAALSKHEAGGERR